MSSTSYPGPPGAQSSVAGPSVSPNLFLTTSHGSASSPSSQTASSVGLEFGHGNSQAPRDAKFSALFAEKLPRYIHLVSTQSNSGLKVHKRVKNFYLKFAKSQEAFAVEVQKLATHEKRKMEDTREPDRMTANARAWSMFFDQMSAVSTLHSEFATTLNHAIVSPLENFYTFATQRNKENQERLATHSAAIQGVKTNIAKARDTARKALAALGERKLQQSTQHGGRHAKEGDKSGKMSTLQKWRSKMEDKGLDKLRDKAMRACETYEREIVAGNIRQEQFYTQEVPSSGVLEKIQGLEELRLRSLIDAMRQFGHSLVRFAADFQKRAENLIELSHTLHVEQDISNFVANCLSIRSGDAVSTFQYDMDLSVEELRAENYYDPKTLFESSLEAVLKCERKLFPEVSPQMDIPLILVALTAAVENKGGFQMEGIFRVSPVLSELKALRQQMEGGDYNIQFPSPHVSSCLLKEWLRLLLEPLIPFTLYEPCVELGKLKTPPDVAVVRATLSAVPALHRRTLAYLFAFMKRLAQPDNVDYTKMNLSNLVLVFVPNVLRDLTESPQKLMLDAKPSSQFLLFVLEHSELLFADELREVRDKSELYAAELAKALTRQPKKASPMSSMNLKGVTPKRRGKAKQSISGKGVSLPSSRHAPHQRSVDSASVSNNHNASGTHSLSMARHNSTASTSVTDNGAGGPLPDPSPSIHRAERERGNRSDSEDEEPLHHGQEDEEDKDEFDEDDDPADEGDALDDDEGDPITARKSDDDDETGHHLDVDEARNGGGDAEKDLSETLFNSGTSSNFVNHIPPRRKPPPPPIPPHRPQTSPTSAGVDTSPSSANATDGGASASRLGQQPPPPPPRRMYGPDPPVSLATLSSFESTATPNTNPRTLSKSPFKRRTVGAEMAPHLLGLVTETRRRSLTQPLNLPLITTSASALISSSSISSASSPQPTPKPSDPNKQMQKDLAKEMLAAGGALRRTALLRPERSNTNPEAATPSTAASRDSTSQTPLPSEVDTAALLSPYPTSPKSGGRTVSAVSSASRVPPLDTTDADRPSRSAALTSPQHSAPSSKQTSPNSQHAPSTKRLSSLDLSAEPSPSSVALPPTVRNSKQDSVETVGKDKGVTPRGAKLSRVNEDGQPSTAPAGPDNTLNSYLRHRRQSSDRTLVSSSSSSSASVASSPSSSVHSYVSMPPPPARRRPSREDALTPTSASFSTATAHAADAATPTSAGGKSSPTNEDVPPSVALERSNSASRSRDSLSRSNSTTADKTTSLSAKPSQLNVVVDAEAAAVAGGGRDSFSATTVSVLSPLPTVKMDRSTSSGGGFARFIASDGGLSNSAPPLPPTPNLTISTSALPLPSPVAIPLPPSPQTPLMSPPRLPWSAFGGKQQLSTSQKFNSGSSTSTASSSSVSSSSTRSSGGGKSPPPLTTSPERDDQSVPATLTSASKGTEPPPTPPPLAVFGTRPFTPDPIPQPRAPPEVHRGVSLDSALTNSGAGAASSFLSVSAGMPRAQSMLVDPNRTMQRPPPPPLLPSSLAAFGATSSTGSPSHSPSNQQQQLSQSQSHSDRLSPRNSNSFPAEYVKVGSAAPATGASNTQQLPPLPTLPATSAALRSGGGSSAAARLLAVLEQTVPLTTSASLSATPSTSSTSSTRAPPMLARFSSLPVTSPALATNSAASIASSLLLGSSSFPNRDSLSSQNPPASFQSPMKSGTQPSTPAPSTLLNTLNAALAEQERGKAGGDGGIGSVPRKPRRASLLNDVLSPPIASTGASTSKPPSGSSTTTPVPAPSSLQTGLFSPVPPPSFSQTGRFVAFPQSLATGNAGTPNPLMSPNPLLSPSLVPLPATPFSSNHYDNVVTPAAAGRRNSQTLASPPAALFSDDRTQSRQRDPRENRERVYDRRGDNRDDWDRERDAVQRNLEREAQMLSDGGIFGPTDSSGIVTIADHRSSSRPRNAVQGSAFMTPPPSTGTSTLSPTLDDVRQLRELVIHDKRATANLSSPMMPAVTPSRRAAPSSPSNSSGSAVPFSFNTSRAISPSARALSPSARALSPSARYHTQTMPPSSYVHSAHSRSSSSSSTQEPQQPQQRDPSQFARDRSPMSPNARYSTATPGTSGRSLRTDTRSSRD